MSEILSKTKLIYGAPVTFTPLISIAIPTYKRPLLLRESIESVLCQNECSSYEVIVLDNDQSPNILDVVNSFDSSKIAVYQNIINVGMWSNMNLALDFAKGKWILILHDDDLLMSNALQSFERLLSLSVDQRIGCLAGGVELFFTGERRPILDTRQRRIRFPIAEKSYSMNFVTCITDNMCLTDTPKFCSTFYRREYIKQIGGWDAGCHGYADLALLLKVQSDGKLYVCKEVFGRLRVHENQPSHPSKLWETYPLHAARRLLSEYVDETTPIGRNIHIMVEKQYSVALWKNPYTHKERRGYASDLLRLINVRAVSRRFLLRNVWFLDILAKLYGTIRSRLSSVSHLLLKNKP